MGKKYGKTYWCPKCGCPVKVSKHARGASCINCGFGFEIKDNEGAE